mgnify:CR=1 FL=1
MVEGIEHQRHNEEGGQSCNRWHHLNNQEEDQTLLSCDEIITAVSITCKYHYTGLDNHCQDGNDNGIKVPSAIKSL